MTDFRNLVVLVDELDNELGTIPKMEAHEKGLLHRAISVLIYNSKGEILIQQRAAQKYHWPLIWANACCSHPYPNETYEHAANRRVKEELGIELELTLKLKFIYKTTDPQTNLIEHELDWVFVGIFDGNIPFNPIEINTIKWMNPDELNKEINENPNEFAFWFKEILNKI